MKALILTCFLSILLLSAFAQNGGNIDTALKFNQRFTKCELKWVVISRADTEKSYLFGFIYIDSQAGFTFDMKGTFTVDKGNHYTVDTSIFRNQSIKYRISPNWRNVALVPPAHFNELHITPKPAWIKFYYNYTDTIQHNFRWGFIYNDAGQSDTALVYLNKAYKANPHFKGLEFEIAYAYNALNEPDKAIAVLESAVKYDPKNIMFYRELGYAYMNKAAYGKAISYYTQGVNLTPDTQKPDESKSEMAYNLASVYHKMNNDNEYKSWMVKAKGWSLPNSNVYKAAVALGF